MASKVILIPLYLSFSIIFGPFLLYVITMNSQHLDNVIPFISDTGRQSPEAPVFTILFNVGAIFVALTVFIRHNIFVLKYQKNSDQIYCSNYVNTCAIRMNNWSNICGSLTVIGLLIIGLFRSSELNSIHNFGTFMTCIFGTTDIILQSMIAFNTDCKKTAIFRLIIVLIIIPNFLGYVFIEFINKKVWNYVYVKDSLGKSVAAVCEWIGFCMFGPFYATFIPEFLRLKNIEIVFNFSVEEKDILLVNESELKTVDQ